MKKYVVSGIIITLLVVAGSLLALSRDNAPRAGATDQSQIASSAGSPARTPLPTSFATGLESLPSSLNGTDVTGEFAVDASGHLKITRGIRSVFDYFLSTVNQEPLATAVLRIRAYIHYRLKEPAAGEAEHILDGYLAYEKGCDKLRAELPPRSGERLDTDALRRQMEQVQALRTEYLSVAVIQAFFGDDDAYDHYMLARLDLVNNKALSPRDRAQQLATLEQQLPEAMQASLKTENQFQDLLSVQDACKQRSCTDTELHQARTELVGPEATARLEALDRENAAWDQRMNSWFSQRDAILANHNMSDSDRQQQLASQRDSLFSRQEQVQVVMLEQGHDEAGAH